MNVFILLILLSPFLLSSSGNSQEVSIVILSQVELVTLSENEIGLSWVTNIPSDTRIEYGTSDSMEGSLILTEETLFHIIIAEDLLSGTEYHYRIGSGGRWSDIMISETLSPEGEPEGITIALVGDSHIDIDGTNNGAGFQYDDSVDIFRSSVQQLNGDPEIDRVIFLGDMVNGAAGDYDSFFDTVSDLDIPWDFTYGNWEKQEEDWESNIGGRLDIDERYYSFDVGSFHFIILDSSVHGQIGGTIDELQFQWLEEDLFLNPYEPSIIVMHHPLEEEGIFTVDDRTKDRLNRIMDRNGQVLSVIAGHNHKNSIVPFNGRYHCSIASLVQYPIGYAKIRLYDQGYSQHFLKVENELQRSEESKLRIDTSAGSQDQHQEYLGSISERSIFLKFEKTRDPVIESFQIYPQTVHPGNIITAEIDSYDPYHGELEISYTMDGEFLSQTGSSITFKAPKSTGVHEIEATVTSEVSSISTSRYFEVVDDGVEIDDPPVIEDIRQSRETAYPGNSITFTVSAYDPDDDPLTYEWESNGRIISDEYGSSLRWTAPDDPGIYEIHVTVTANGKSDRAEATVKVIQKNMETGDDIDSAPFVAHGSLILLPIIVLILVKRKRISL